MVRRRKASELRSISRSAINPVTPWPVTGLTAGRATLLAKSKSFNHTGRHVADPACSDVKEVLLVATWHIRVDHHEAVRVT
jgi:hypothetical protein